MWCPKILSSRSLCKGPVLYPAKNEEIYGIVPYQKFSCHVTLLLKRKLQHVGHKWVTSGSYIYGSHPDCSVGQWVKWVNRCNPLSTLVQTIYILYRAKFDRESFDKLTVGFIRKTLREKSLSVTNCNC